MINYYVGLRLHNNYLGYLSVAFSGLMLGVMVSASAPAETYPTRPVRMVVPYAAGGNADIQGRIVAQRLTAALGTQVVVDNRPGANGVIGTELVAKAPGDGYTVLFVASGHAINPALYRKLPFDPVRDFAPVSLVGSIPLMVTATPALAAQSVKELVALARSRPGQLSFASQGNGSPGHLAGVIFNTAAGVDIVHVPYKATAQAITDLIGGQMQLMYPSLSSVMPHVKSGKLRSLAVTSHKRSALAPGVPTMAESGFPGYEASIWNALLLPAKAAKPVVGRLNAETIKIMQAPEVKEQYAALGAEPLSSTPEALVSYLQSEIAKWGKAVQTAGARVE